MFYRLMTMDLIRKLDATRIELHDLRAWLSSFAAQSPFEAYALVRKAPRMFQSLHKTNANIGDIHGQQKPKSFSLANYVDRAEQG